MQQVHVNDVILRHSTEQWAKKKREKERERKRRQWRCRQVKAPVSLQKTAAAEAVTCEHDRWNDQSDKWSRSPGEHFPVSRACCCWCWCTDRTVVLNLTKPLISVASNQSACSLGVLSSTDSWLEWRVKEMAAMKNDRSPKTNWLSDWLHTVFTSTYTAHKRIVDQSFILMSSPDWHTAIYLIENYNEQKIKSKINYLLRPPIGHGGEWVQLQRLSLANSSCCLPNNWTTT